MPDELEALFRENPNLTRVLQQWESQPPPGSAGFSLQGEASAEDVEAFLARNAGQRAPLSGVVSGQQAGAPQFLPGQGRMVPPAGATEFDGESQSGQQAPPPPQSAPPVQPGPASQEGGDSHVPPGAPPPPPAPDAFINLNGRQVPLSQVEQLLEFADALENSPELQARITQALAPTPQQYQPPQPPPAPPLPTPPVAPPGFGGQQEGAPVPPAGAPPAPSPQPAALPPELQAYADDPAIQALWLRSQALESTVNGKLAEVQSQVQAQQQAWQERQQTEISSLVARARDSFAQQYSLDPPTMERLVGIAAGLEVLPALSKGFNPSTGAWEEPDTMTAVERALEIAYWQDPQLREAYTHEQAQRAQADSRRKQLAGAVSGSSGSAPRTPAPQVPSSPEGRLHAATQEVGQMLRGDWSPPDQ